MLRFLFLIAAFSFSAFATNSDPHAVVIDPPAEVKLIDFDRCSFTFEIELVGEEGAGPFYVSGDEVVASIASISKGLLKDSPDAFLNRKFSIQKKIAFHPPPYLDKRRKELCK